MKKIKHLTEKQLLSYADGSLNKQDSQIVGSHLLSCVDCREALPVPTAQRFFELFTEDFDERKEEIEKQKDKESFSLLPIFSYLSSFIGQPQTLILGSTGLVLILSFSFLFWIVSGNKNEQLGKEMASIPFEKNKITDISATESPLQIIKQSNKKEGFKNKDQEIQKIKKRNNINIQERDPNLNTSPKNKNKGNSSSRIKRVSPKRKKPKQFNKISSTRGGSDSLTKCDEKELKGNVQTSGNELILRWKKIPDAKKYHLFVSDDEEILIDEYETQERTSYKLRKPLDPEKTYSWKILVTFENGETKIGISKKFTLKEFQKVEENTLKKDKKLVRCSEKTEK